MPNFVAFKLRIAPELHARLAASAKENSRSLNSELIARLERQDTVAAAVKETLALLAGVSR